MLSRLYPAISRNYSPIFKCTLVSNKLEPISNALFKIHSNGSAAQASPVAFKASAIVEGPERDLVNFPRPVQAVYGGKVRLGFLPEEWFGFFYKKTGVTGPYVFGVGLITFLMSKEIYVVEHEFWNGVSLFMLFIYAVKKFGPMVAEVADKETAEYMDDLNASKNASIKHYENSIAEEKKEQWRLEGQKYLFEAKQENVALQLEAEYRRRMSQAYNEVKKRLDYQLNVVNFKRSTEHKHMVNWIVGSVMKSITPQQEQDALKKCISDLKMLAASA